MFSTSDTIVAIATPPGRGAIGIVRLSGPAALDIARRLTGRVRPFVTRRATLARIQPASPGDGMNGRGADPPHSAVDQVIVTTFPAPASYTGEDVAEISGHGSPVVLRGIVSAAVTLGARLAEPGEFTLRAFLNGRVDLPQAEAVADLIDSVTPGQARLAFDQLQGTLTQAIAGIDEELLELVARLEASVDFPEEGYHFIEPSAIARRLDDVMTRVSALLTSAAGGRLVRDGCVVAIVGAPNVGKSSLFNALVGSARAIVTEIAGTTRDLISETVDVKGVPVTFVDTAGLRPTQDVVEAEGVSRSVKAARTADLVIEVFDGSRRLTGAEREHVQDAGERAREWRHVRVSNKADLAQFEAVPESLAVSATTGAGLDRLQDEVVATLVGSDLGERPAVSNIRHIELLGRAYESMRGARQGVTDHAGALSEEFVLADLAEARAALEEITGKRTSDDVLRHIFERFCVGK